MKGKNFRGRGVWFADFCSYILYVWGRRATMNASVFVFSPSGGLFLTCREKKIYTVIYNLYNM
jgi:hypothetical protein